MKKVLVFMAMLGMVLSLASCGDDFGVDDDSFDVSTMTEQEILSTFVGEWKVNYKWHYDWGDGDTEDDSDTQTWKVGSNGKATFYSHDEEKEYVNEGVITLEKQGKKVYIDCPMLFMRNYAKYELVSLTANSFVIKAETNREYHYLKGKKK